MDGLKKEIEKLFTAGLSQKTVLMMVKDVYKELTLKHTKKSEERGVNYGKIDME